MASKNTNRRTGDAAARKGHSGLNVPANSEIAEAPQGLEFHPLANLFPLLEGAEFDELVEDVRIHGVREPITLHDGKILDGRNRYRLAAAAGVPCPMRFYTGNDPIAFVISLNLKRRHLSEAQRAMVAAKLATMHQGERTDLSPIGERLSQADAANLLNVGKRSVERAKLVRDQGTPELVEAVERGDLSISAAAEHVRPTTRELLTQSNQNDWRTPRKFLDAARAVMGAIDLDPASSAEANETVRATRFYTEADDGLRQPWRGCVWLNPPYGGEARLFVERLLREYQVGNVTADCALLNSHPTETKWFQELFE
jgi:hypothetical protein